MADNVKISYYARENTKVGVHSIYPQPVFKGTFGFDRMCKKAANNTTIEEHTVRAAVFNTIEENSEMAARTTTNTGLAVFAIINRNRYETKSGKAYRQG